MSITSRPLRVAITGCSGGGKTTLINALAEAGFRTVEEPGRNIVQAALKSGEDVLPWRNPAGFAERAAELSLQSWAEIEGYDCPVFFDRTVIDAVSHLERHGLGVPETVRQAEAACRLTSPVFFAPPWREIHINDEERPVPFEEAVQEYDHLIEAYGARGYAIILLPKTSVEARILFVLEQLGLASKGH